MMPALPSNPLHIWLLAIRPKTLMASICPVLLGTALVLSEGTFEPLLFLFTLFTAIGIQICTNLANDYFDCIKGADTSSRKGPVRVTQAGLVSQAAMKRGMAIAFSLTALCSAYLISQGGVAIALLSALALVLALAYTAGPLPLAYLGLGDLFVLLFFGPIATGATFYLQMHSLSLDSLLVGLGPGALSSAILMTNNLRDIEEDRKANKKTLPVRFGRPFGKALYLLAILIALLLPALFMAAHPFALLAALSFVPALALALQITRGKEAEDFAPLLPKTAQLLFLYTILFSIGWML